MDRATDEPADLGTGVVCASFGGDGSWLSLGTLHPRWGFVELNGLPAFDESERGDPAATRRHRARMTDPRHAWLRIDPVDPGDRVRLASSVDDPSVVTWEAVSGDRPRARAFGQPGSRRLVQRWQLGDGIERIVRVAGRLDRPALAEITEVSPPDPTGALTEFRADGGRLVVWASELPAAAAIEASIGRWVVAAGGAELRVGRGVPAFELSVTLTPDLETMPGPPAAVRAPAAPMPRDLPRGVERLVTRALTYVRSCTALEFVPGERAFLTDHRILPLSWTRDGYYQALLLLATGAASDVTLVADHLRWLWRRCERPGGRWMRSHHGNGQPKDLAFQADQQLYPFVELADLWRATRALPDGVEWGRLVPEAWDSVVSAIDPGSGLIATEENAADDRAEAAFTAGSQVLLWYTAMRLAEPDLAAHVGLAPENLERIAARVRAAFDRHLRIGDRWAYASDGHGRAVDYHDANDLPTVLAPLWGFCAADDAAWRGTVEYSFSPANPAFVDGPEGGLGSAHTPGCWPLGLVQAWLVGRITGDEGAAAVALDRLQRAALRDGMLPETLVADGPAVVPVRHWFAWPGAALGAFWLLDRRDALGLLDARPPG
ncbi:MAG TPA: glycoside hydrolase family 125 protein [Candidatus Limnocylindrales bacterium]|nr:glycoside hydrolase family 125 protein [Candidatus Limnocylindrales bacterium]